MILIKRYPNRKLYNTDTKQYITLESIADLMREGDEVQVIDHATGEDLTTLTLTQIILEQQKKRSGLLTNTFLTDLIQASGDRLSALQETIRSSGSFLRQFDEEVRRRIQWLVHQGEMTEKEGARLVDKLIHQAESKHLEDSEFLENYLRQKQIPTHDDLQQLYAQLEELSTKVDQLRSTGS
jgi:polyhydroxyalkanoate synthesis repressor PhaR